MTRALVATVALGAVLSFGFAELALRGADALGWIRYWERVRTAQTSSIWQPSPVPGLHYIHRENYLKEGVRQTEAHGILSPIDVPVTAPEGFHRIAVLGDSVSAALDLPFSDRFTTRLERVLSGPGHPVQVLNFGVNGYATQQQALLLETHVATFAPDLIVLQYCMNDLRPSERPLGWFRPISSSYLIAWVRYQIERQRELGYPLASYWERAYREDVEGWRQVTNNLARIGAWAAAREVPAVLAIVPVLSHEGWRAGDAAGRHHKVSDVGRESGFEVLDMLPVLEVRPVDALRPNAWDTFHLNTEGHRLMSDALVEQLREMGWPPVAESR